MSKLSVFNFLTLNGYYKGLNDDISWHSHGSDEAEFAAEGAQTESILLFGRKTYEMMASFWPTPAGMEMNPAVAEGMNKSEKIVASRTLNAATWKNSRIIKGDMVKEIKKLKQTTNKDITVLGSGSIVTQLADAGLIDVFQFMVDPVALGDGTPLFKGLTRTLDLKLTKTKAFRSGVILAEYEPMEK